MQFQVVLGEVSTFSTVVCLRVCVGVGVHHCTQVCVCVCVWCAHALVQMLIFAPIFALKHVKVRMSCLHFLCKTKLEEVNILSLVFAFVANVLIFCCVMPRGEEVGDGVAECVYWRVKP